ncbi:MAG: FAD binding domain-containing protein [Lachnospiraceae bacterium]|jgi:carbon-monoxide dehydrogenase medium subunit/xanthine dehydrogenase FAD-binding subunit|nr:FAD binding domain-containing protein [Lachnospiraceae bacterium]
MVDEKDYLVANNLNEAKVLMHEHCGNIHVLAGGTDLMVALREGKRSGRDTTYLLDISNIQELKAIERKKVTISDEDCNTNEDYIRIGAMVTFDEAAHSGLLLKTAGALCEAAKSVGAQQIRNVATIGGNVCNAAVAADSLSALTILDAKVVLEDLRGERVLSIGEFITGPGKTAINEDELLTEIRFKPLEDYYSAFVKLGRRKALAISRMNVAAALAFEDEKITEARISPGCVFATPRRVQSAEKILIGESPSEELFMEAGEEVSKEMVRITGRRWSTDYKYPALSAVTFKALAIAYNQAKSDT